MYLKELQMHRYMIAVLLGVSVLAGAQQPNSSTLRTVLLQELRETHNEKGWFVSEREAIAGLTPEQAAWSDGKNHSAGQLLEHLNYWNAVHLAKFKKQPARNTPNN